MMGSRHRDGVGDSLPQRGQALRVLGVDPGSKATGFGVIDRLGSKLVHVAHGTLRPKAGSLQGRLAELHALLSEVVRRWEPDVASVEQVFVSASPRSALVLGQARGAALAALGGLAVSVEEYSPASIKQSVSGSGRATKSQVQQMVRRLLALEVKPAQDAADALAAAICHAHAGRLAGLVKRRVQKPSGRRVARLRAGRSS